MTGNLKGRLLRSSAAVIAWLEHRRNPLWRGLYVILSRLQERLSGSLFARNTIVMLVGSVLGQATSVLLSPVLTRIYTPEEFGQLSVFMSTIYILAIVGALRYEIALPIAKTPAEAVNLYGVCTIVLVLTTSTVAFVAAFIPVGALASMGLQALDGYRVLIPIGFVFLGAYYIVLYYATWAQDFSSISRTRISQGISGPVSQIALGLAGLHGVGLAIGFAIGQSSGTFLLFNRMVLKRPESLRDISVTRMLQLAWRHRGYPLIASWSSMIDIAGAGQLVYILVAALYPGPTAGFMFVSERVVSRPLQVLSTSLLTVYMAEIGQSVKTDPARLSRRFRQVISRQLVFSGCWVLAIDTIAAVAFPYLFGADWANAVPFLLVLSIAFLINSVVGSVGATLQVLERQTLSAAWQIGRVLAVIAGFVVSDRLALSAFQAIILYTVVQVAACLILLYLIRWSIERVQLSWGLSA